MFCLKCGSELKDNVKFCAKCGTAVQTNQKEAPNPAQAADEKAHNTTQMKEPEQTPKPEQNAAEQKPGEMKLLAACASLGMLIIAALIFLCVRILGNGELAGRGGASADSAAVDPASSDAVASVSGGEEEIPLYYIENIGVIDVYAQNHTPGTRVEGMVWDGTLFYWLEDVDLEDASDGNIANCVIYKTLLKDAETGNPIQYEVYKDRASGEIYKIVSIEQSENGLRLVDYYYDGGRPNFIFVREDSVYTPTYATPSKVGHRYYFKDDVMVKWRIILTPDVVNDFTLTPGSSIYMETAYNAMTEEQRNAYDTSERQMLNAAYNTYNAVADGVGIGLLEGRLTDTAGSPVSGMSVKIYRKEDNVLLYMAVTDEDGYFVIYTYLDNTECCLVINGTEIYDGYTVASIRLNISTLVQSYNDIVMYKISENVYPVYVDVYSALEVYNDAVGNMLQGASITIRRGSGAYEGEALKTLEADGSGRLRTDLPSGIYTAQVQVPGYADSYLEIEVAEGETTAACYVMPTPAPGETGVVLTWSGAEADLDLTLFTPYQSTGGDMAHIGGGIMADVHGNRLLADNSAYCEVMYINTSEMGSYKLYVNNYTDSLAGNYGSTLLATMEIHIYIYDSNGFVTEYTCPAGQSGVVWEIVEISGTNLTASGRVYDRVDGKTWWTGNKDALDMETVDSSEWRQAYYDYLINNSEYISNDDYSYCLLYLDDDAIPEILIEAYSYSYVDALLYYYDGQVWEEDLYLYDFIDGGYEYIPRSGLLHSFGGRMDWYSDTVLRFKNGTLQEIASGGYCVVWDENGDNMVFQKGEWNGQSVTSKEEYYLLLGECYNNNVSVGCRENSIEESDKFLAFLLQGY